MYDAFGRVMEQNNGGAYTQLLYSPCGNLFATMNGSTAQDGKPQTYRTG